jgi:NAD(P)-dependent dehydrogenase (short-subunit alcohol dehydrogenase family)
MSSPSLFIVGAGPGIALKAAQKFASEGFNIALISRSASKLAEQAKLIEEGSTGSGKSGSVKVVTETADASDYDGTRQALEKVKEKLGNPTVVLYNAASLGMARTHALELTPQVGPND